MSRWKEAAHLIRPAIVFLFLILAFVALRHAVIPPSFGQYGHYRGNVLAEIRKLPVKHAGQEACAGCHTDVAEVRSKGHHQKVSCEVCHGPQNTHAQDPGSVKPPKPQVTVLCRNCHEKDPAKPAFLKQVVTAEHAGDNACQGCHNAHSPKM